MKREMNLRPRLGTCPKTPLANAGVQRSDSKSMDTDLEL